MRFFARFYFVFKIIDQSFMPFSLVLSLFMLLLNIVTDELSKIVLIVPNKIACLSGDSESNICTKTRGRRNCLGTVHLSAPDFFHHEKRLRQPELCRIKCFRRFYYRRFTDLNSITVLWGHWKIQGGRFLVSR